MEANEFTPEQSFAIIDKAVSNFKTNYKESAQVFLLWGWILTLASFSNFVILKILETMEAYHLMGPLSLGNWVIFWIIGFAILRFMNRKNDKEKKVYSHLDGYLRSLWSIAGLSFFVALVLCIRLQVESPAFFLLIGGLATTTSGLLIKFNPLTMGGIAFFVFSIVSTFVFSVEYVCLVVCAAIICGYLVPGYLLKSAKS